MLMQQTTYIRSPIKNPAQTLGTLRHSMHGRGVHTQKQWESRSLSFHEMLTHGSPRQDSYLPIAPMLQRMACQPLKIRHRLAAPKKLCLVGVAGAWVPGRA